MLYNLVGLAGIVDVGNIICTVSPLYKSSIYFNEITSFVYICVLVISVSLVMLFIFPFYLLSTLWKGFYLYHSIVIIVTCLSTLHLIHKLLGVCHRGRILFGMIAPLFYPGDGSDKIVMLESIRAVLVFHPEYWKVHSHIVIVNYPHMFTPSEYQFFNSVVEETS